MGSAENETTRPLNNVVKGYVKGLFQRVARRIQGAESPVGLQLRAYGIRILPAALEMPPKASDRLLVHIVWDIYIHIIIIYIYMLL